MKRVAFLLLAAIVALPMAWNSAVSQSPSTADGGVRQAAAAYGTALHKGDLDGILSFWTNDADYMDDTGRTYKGREALGKLYQPALEGLKKGKIAVVVDSVRLLKPDVAVVDGAIDFTPVDGPFDRNRFSSVWTRTNDRWQIASARELPDLEGDAADRCQKDLAWLVGDWMAEDKETTIKMTCKPIIGNKFLRMEFDVKNPSGEFTIWQIVGWDPVEALVRSWTFDSRGGFGSGEWTRDANKWLGETHGVLANGVSGSSNITVKMQGHDAFIWKATDREIDGKPIPDSELKYTRASKR